MHGCEHCYCIDVPPTLHRRKPHVKCCKCGDVRVRYGGAQWQYGA